MPVPSFSVRPLTPVEAQSWVATGQLLTEGTPDPALNRLVPALHAAGRDPGEFLIAEGVRGQVLGLLRCRFRPGGRAEVIAPVIPEPAHVDEVGRSLLARFLADCWGRQSRHITGFLLIDPPQGDTDALDQLLVAMGFRDVAEESLIRADLARWSPREASGPMLAWRTLHELGNLHFVSAWEAIEPVEAGHASEDLLAMRAAAGHVLEPQRWKIAYRDGEAIGIVIAQSWPSDPTTGALFRLAVHPDHQGKGYGRVLFEEGLRQLKEAWVTTYLGGVDLRTPACAHLYGSLGYETVEVQRRYQGPGWE